MRRKYINLLTGVILFLACFIIQKEIIWFNRELGLVIVGTTGLYYLFEGVVGK